MIQFRKIENAQFFDDKLLIIIWYLGGGKWKVMSTATATSNNDC